MMKRHLAVISLTCILNAEDMVQEMSTTALKKEIKTGRFVTVSQEINNEQYDKVIVRRHVDEPDYMQEILKCCPEGFHLDDWYNCVNVHSKSEDRFDEELLEIGAKGKEKYVIVNSKEWENCPMRQRNEFEVLHIPHDKNNTVYVFTEVEVDYDVTKEEEINFNGFREIKYSCLEVSEDFQSITALVCMNEEEAVERKSFIKKCCPEGQGLTRNFSSCEDIEHQWIPPRKVVHHKTEKMTGSYHPIFGQELCAADEILIAKTAVAVTTDGQFKTSSEVAGVQAYHCVDTLVQHTDQDSKSNELVAVVCLQQGCTSQACLSKCCPENEMIARGESLCAPANDPSQLWTHHNKLYDHQLNILPQDSLKNMKIEYSNHFMSNYLKHPSLIPNCDGIIIIDKSINNTVFILQNGSLYHQENGLTEDYCVDNTFDTFGDVVQIILKCTKDILDEEKSYSIEDSDTKSCLDDYKDILRLLNTASCIISCIFLVITFLVYIFVPELNNLHGKIVLSNVFTIFLLTAYLLLVYNSSHYLNGVLCQIVGYSGYFLTMSMFTWMTIMSFDLCWTFMRAKVPRKGAALLKFVIYSAVAWGSSAAMTVAVILADLEMEEKGEDEKQIFTKPNVGKQKCFLQDQSQGLYLHVPIMLLMIVNGIFFIITTITLYR